MKFSGGQEDAAKMLVNIKKRKERAKRKKAARDEEDGEDSGDEVRSFDVGPTMTQLTLPSSIQTAQKPTTGDAFEDVLYGSESELESEDEDAPSQKKSSNGKSNRPISQNGSQPRSILKKGGAHGGTRLRVDNEEPMDLLEGAAGGLTCMSIITSSRTIANLVLRQLANPDGARNQVRKHQSSRPMRTRAR